MNFRRVRALESLSPEQLSFKLSSSSSKLYNLDKSKPLHSQLAKLIPKTPYFFDDEDLCDEFPGLYGQPWFKSLVISCLILEHKPLLLLPKVTFYAFYSNKLKEIISNIIWVVFQTYWTCVQKVCLLSSLFFFLYW